MEYFITKGKEWKRQTLNTLLLRLNENGLCVLDEVCDLSARMVVNQVSMKMENERILKIINDLRKYVEAK